MDLIRDETVFPSALMHCIGFEEVLSLGADGTAEVRFRARPEFAHSKGTTVQGGIVTAWLDCAMAWAVALLRHPSYFAFVIFIGAYPGCFRGFLPYLAKVFS